jgi:chemotaxis protein MotB
MRHRGDDRLAGDDVASEQLFLPEWETQDQDDGWLVSYADILSVILTMVVLLLGRMVVAHTPPVPAEVEPEMATATVEPAPVAAPEEAPAAPISVPTPTEAETAAIELQESAPSQQTQLAALVEQRFQGRIKAEQQNEGLLLTIADVVLFDSSSANLQESAEPMLTDLASTLSEIGEAQISVEGHTDDRPIQGGAFASNWDLAAARANVVARFLLTQGLAAARLRSVSYADTRPVSGNATTEGRAANRRVELRIEFPKEGTSGS